MFITVIHLTEYSLFFYEPGKLRIGGKNLLVSAETKRAVPFQRQLFCL